MAVCAPKTQNFDHAEAQLHALLILSDPTRVNPSPPLDGCGEATSGAKPTNKTSVREDSSSYSSQREEKQTQTKQTCLKRVLRRGTRSPPGTSSLHFHRPRTEATPRPVTCLRGRGYAFLRFIWTVAHFLSSCHCCGVQGKWGGREGDGGEERDEKGGGGGGERQRQRRGQEGRKG